MSQSNKFSIILHTGAGDISSHSENKIFIMKNFVENLIKQSLSLINEDRRKKTNLTAIDLSSFIVSELESSGLFNAGKGSVARTNGAIVNEAAISDSNGNYGSCMGLRSVEFPILLAKEIMLHSDEKVLIPPSVEKYAIHRKLNMIDSDSYYVNSRYYNKDIISSRINASFNDEDYYNSKSSDHDTVGCVVLYKDVICSSVSTGGVSNRCSGRVGDAPFIGAGIHTNDACGVSCTGIGEKLINHCLAYQVTFRMKQLNQSLQDAIDSSIKFVEHNCAGIIGADKFGNVYAKYNTPSMIHAYYKSNQRKIIIEI